jgi:hypothetical protein
MQNPPFAAVGDAKHLFQKVHNIMYPEPALCATSSDHPQYFICLKNGRWHPVDVPPGTLAVLVEGQYRAVFSPAETDAEYFAKHPDAKFRLKLQRSPLFRPDYFLFEIVTRDSEVYATGDAGDLRYYRPDRGSPREWLLAECERMLADSNRCPGSDRWLADQGTRQ